MSTNNKINSWSTLFQNFKDKAKTGATGAVDKTKNVAKSVLSGTKGALSTLNERFAPPALKTRQPSQSLSPQIGNTSVGASDTSLLGQAKSLNEKYGGNILSYDTSNMTTDALRGYNSDLFKYQNIMAYNAATDAAKKSATEAESYANTRRMLMQKYIPDTMKAMGLSGTGASANALLQMDNAYNGYALNAKSQAAQAEQNALQEYQNALATYTQNANEEKLLQKQTESKDVRNAYEAQITSRVDGLIANGEKLTAKEYNAIWSEIEGNASLTDEDKNALYAQLESYAMGNYGVYSAEEESKANAAKAGEEKTTQEAETATAEAEQETEYAKSYQVNLTDGRATSVINTTDNVDTIVHNLGVSKGEEQTEYINSIMRVSAGWDSSKNGTYVDFNYGNTSRSGSVGDIYVFIDGKWYLTNYKRNDAPSKVYSEPKINRGDSWYDNFDFMRRTNKLR